MVSYHISLRHSRLIKFLYTVHSTVMCKTSEGYWVAFSAPVQAMNLLKEHLKRDPMLEEL